ncbi:MAG: alcohol dehydrogenase catalytic domain-containing protein [Phycisphaerae bacterium]|nr:alcohol dehydrogenase catalytic domain-containing protein [Phycisphaerae bacterium]
MRALLLDSRAWLDPRTADPVASAGDALIRVRRVVLTRRETLAAPSCAPPIPGRCFVGTVERAPAARPAWAGVRVVGMASVACSTCDACRAGLGAHCPARTVPGLTRPGAAADLIALPAHALAPVPDTLDDDRAAFGALAASAAHAASLLRVQGKTYITVLGDGPLGLLTAQALARLNASVRLLGRREARFSLCEKWGIKHRHESEAGRRADQDIVVDCTGSVGGLDLALRLVRPRGKIVVKPLAPRADEPKGLERAALARLIDNEVEVLGSRDGQLADGLGLLSRGQIDPLPLISRRVGLADAPAAVEHLRLGDPVCALIDPTPRT